ncbi:MAG: phosphatase PAP2 family protein, partial [Bacilli bacterium]|nr:phosphatase PAP2 family protein [Bacilli bacterium]
IDNNFGRFFSTIGTIPGYGVLAIIGGAFFQIGLKRKDYTTPIRFLLYFGALVALGAAIFFSGREFFSRNGFYEHENLKPLGFVIILPIMGGLGYLGYYLANHSDNKNLWFVLLIMSIFIFLSLVGGVTLLKSVFHRPRFRALGGGLEFHHWWERCANYEDYLITYSKEDFKSFPSGHAGACAVAVMFACFLPLFNKKYQNIQLPIIYVALAWTLFISFTRINAGAHFLSDVSMGALLTMGATLIANEILIHTKRFAPQEAK